MNTLTLLTQPERENTCAHHCLAMVLGEGVERILIVTGTGKMNGMSFTALMKYVRNNTASHDITHVTDNRRRIELPEGRGVLSVYPKSRTQMGHCVAFCDGKIYDPHGVVYDSLSDLKAEYRRRWGACRIGYIIAMEPVEQREYAVAGKN